MSGIAGQQVAERQRFTVYGNMPALYRRLESNNTFTDSIRTPR